MSGFLYFLPGARGSVDDAMLQRFGLLHVRDGSGDALHARDVVANGPGGMPGIAVGHAKSWAAEQVKQSESIEWVKFPKAHAEGQAWLGWLKGEPLPTPAALARSEQLPGQWLTLADDNRWLVPTARDFSGNCQLPIAYDIDEETGDWQPTKVRREYQAIWDHALAYYSAMREAFQSSFEQSEAGGTVSVSFEVPNGQALVVDALAVNYRVSARELATLGVLVTGLVQQVGEILIDVDGSEELKKKRGVATGNA